LTAFPRSTLRHFRLENLTDETLRRGPFSSKLCLTTDPRTYNKTVVKISSFRPYDYGYFPRCVSVAIILTMPISFRLLKRTKEYPDAALTRTRTPVSVSYTLSDSMPRRGNFLINFGCHAPMGCTNKYRRLCKLVDPSAKSLDVFSAGGACLIAIRLGPNRIAGTTSLG
jgi:hypothetical protein